MTTSRWSLRDGAAAGALLALLWVHVQVASAQSLAEVARREAERRTPVAAGREYTNADLAPDVAAAALPAPLPVEPAAGPGASTPSTPAAPAAPGEEAEPADNPGVESIIVEAQEKRDEQYWRARAKDLRRRLAKTTDGIATEQARLSQIGAAPQTPTTVREREVIAATLSRLQRDAGSLREEFTRFITQAAAAAVPAAWTQ